MADETPVEAPVEGAPAKPKKSKKTLVIIVVAILAVVGGAVFAMRRGGEPVAPPRGLVAFDPFVVNLADPGGMRFIRLTLQIVTYDEKSAKEMTESPLEMKESRSIILEILSQQVAADLVKVEGKAALKKSIIESLSKVLKDTKVVDVFFSEFVVQF